MDESQELNSENHTIDTLNYRLPARIMTKTEELFTKMLQEKLIIILILMMSLF